LRKEVQHTSLYSIEDQDESCNQPTQPASTRLFIPAKTVKNFLLKLVKAFI